MSPQPHQKPAASEDGSGLGEENDFHQQHPKGRVSHRSRGSCFQASPSGASDSRASPRGWPGPASGMGDGLQPRAWLRTRLGPILDAPAPAPCATVLRDPETPDPGPREGQRRPLWGQVLTPRTRDSQPAPQGEGFLLAPECKLQSCRVGPSLCPKPYFVGGI